MTKIISVFLLIFYCFHLKSQALIAGCNNAQNICTNPNFLFQGISGNGLISGLNISNPSTNPQLGNGNNPLAAANSGCLLTSGPGPQWLILTVSVSGNLGFIFGSPSSPNPQVGLYDWAMWPYTLSTCANIFNNTLPPVSCNWNASASGGTGMGAVPPTGNVGNYQPSLPVLAGQQFLILISNYSGVNTSVSFTSTGTASLTCGSSTVICTGVTTTVTPIGFVNLLNQTYTLQPGGLTNATGIFSVTPLISTTYTIIGSGLNTQSIQATQTSTTNVTVISVSANITTNSVSCYGNSTGSSSVTVNGGTSPYTYTWLPTGGNATTAINLSAGNYSCQLKDLNNCLLTKTLTIAQPSASLTAVIATNSVLCFGSPSGSVSATVNGGTIPYTYTWLPTGGNATTAFNMSAGNYSFQLIDLNNCTLTETLTITQPSASLTTVIATNSVLCYGTSTGSVSVIANGGTSPYTYTWVPAVGSLSVALNLIAGNNYQVQVKDANNCTSIKTYTIAQPSASLTAIIATNSVLCYGNSTGSALATVNGGTSPYTYTWSPTGGNTLTAINFSAATYSFQVTDLNNCTLTKTLTIAQPSASLTAVIATNSVLCFGSSTGSALATVNGGTSPYTYTWIPTGGNATTAINMSAGNYSIQITDINNCTLTESLTITQPSASLSAVISTNSVLCYGNASGSASVLVNGGTNPYTYSWSPTGGNSLTAINLITGFYFLQITDLNNCTLTKTLTIAQPSSSLTAVIATNSVLCYGNSTGYALATVNGGTGPYSFSWTPTGGNTLTAINLSVGNYSFQVTDLNNCSLTKTLTIAQPSNSLTATIASNSVLCYGYSTGSATATVNGGTLPYLNSWLPFGGTNNFATSLISGTYTFQITDLNNCTLSSTVMISEPSNSLTASIASNSILCFGNATGSASVSANGGTSPFTYTWLPSGGTGTVTNNRIAGNYWVQIKDNNNCPIIPSPTVFISQPLFPLSSSVISNSILCYGNTTGTASVNLIGGTGPYTYTWLPNSVNTFTANNLAAGNYSIQMSDANNCKLTASVSINGPSLLTSTVNSQGLCLNKTTTLIALVNGGTLPYSYFWNTVAGNYSAAVNSTVTVTYTLNVIDANGCSAPIDTATAYLPIPISLIISPIQTICPTSSAQLSVNASGGLSNYTYKWLPGNWQGPTLGVTILNLTIYSVTVWDGCVSPKTATTSVSLYPIGSPSIIPSSYYGCSPHCVEFINPALNSTLAIQKTFWSFGDIITSGIITPTICFDKDGFYNVTNSYTTQQGCFNKAEMNGQISVLKTPIANFELEKTEINYLTPTMKFNNQSINSNFYIWNFADRDQSYETHPSYNFDEPGFYKITLIAKNSNCSDTISKLVESKPVFSFYAPNSFSPNDDDKNDIFLPVGEGWKKNTYNLMVFDRWGNKIFDSGENYVGWDGKNNSKYMGAGVYIWKVSLFDYLGKHHLYTGHVTIY